MKHKAKKIGVGSLVLVFVLGILFSPLSSNSSVIYAASQKSKALKAYRNFLARDKKKYDEYRGTYEFCVKDVNHDGIPELFINHGRTGDMEWVYSFTGKTVRVILGTRHGGISFVDPRKGIIAYSDQSSSKQKHIDDYGMIQGYIRIFPKAKYSVLAEEIVGKFDGSKDSYYVNEKKVKKSTYDNKVKQIKRKGVKLQYHKYSPANLSKYCK